MRARTLTAPVLCAGLLLAAACGSGAKETTRVPGVPAADAAARLDEHRWLGAPFDVENLRIWPVHTDAPLDVGEFLTLQEAQAAGVATVREIGGGAAGDGQVRNVRAGHRNRPAAGGNDAQRPAAQAAPASQDEEIQRLEQELAEIVDAMNGMNAAAEVNRLEIENSGSLPLLVCAGTIVKGGNQDRQIGQDIVVAAGETVPVDAFCVEPGRWTSVREGVANSGEFVAMMAMTSKDVRAKGQYEDDQSGVWQEVAQLRSTALLQPQVRAARLSGVSARPSMPEGTTLVDAIEKVDAATKERRKGAVAAILARFAELAAGDAPPVGFAYAVNGEPQSIRVFAHERLLAQNLESFATTMALEAEVAHEQPFEPCDADRVVAMVAAIAQDAEMTRERTQAANVNVLYRNVKGFNGNCYVDDGKGNEVPLTQDWTRK